ncbi:hypothetical protein KCU64_g2006, partial [Aureobasidium melanogenum]
MFETVVELVNKVLIFPTKLSTQKQELKAEQQRTAATFLRSQDNIRIALNKPGLTKEELEEILRDAKEEQGKDWPEKSEANQHMFMFDAWIYKPPEKFVVRGLLDTGADVSWISIEALRRANLTTGIKRVTNLQEFVGFDGKQVQALGKITIQWWYTGVEAINQTDFFVIENFGGDELDMIVGTEDIIKHELVVLKSATRVLRRYYKPKEIRKAAKNAKHHDALNEVLAQEQDQKETREFERRRENLRAENSCAPSSSVPSTNATKPRPQTRPRPPVPPKSASLAGYPASSSRVQDTERTQSSPEVTVNVPEDTPPSPSLHPPEAHSRSPSMASRSRLSSLSNLTVESTTTPRTSQSSENSFKKFLANFKRQGDDDRDQEQQAGASNHGSGPSKRLHFRWRRGQD